MVGNKKALNAILVAFVFSNFFSCADGHHVKIKLEIIGDATSFYVDCSDLGGNNKTENEEISRNYSELPWIYEYTINGDIWTDDKAKTSVGFCVTKLLSDSSSITARIYADDVLKSESTTNEPNGIVCVEAEVWSY